MQQRIYLTLERGRDIALRNLLRKVFLAGGFDEMKEDEKTPVRRTRIPVAEFHAAIRISSGGEAIDADEVECLLANMIYKVSRRVPAGVPQCFSISPLSDLRGFVGPSIHSDLEYVFWSNAVLNIYRPFRNGVLDLDYTAHK